MHDEPTFPPDFFLKRLEAAYDARDVERILSGCTARRPVTLRANTLKSSREAIAQALDAARIGWSPCAWYPDAFIIHDVFEDAVRELEAYREGWVYLQSLSSMIPPLALGAAAGEDVCDLCAAPGGKTSQIAALTCGNAYITACELHAPRAERLAYNLDKLGVRNVNVMRTDARTLDDLFRFDRLLLDAPCTGSGTLNAADPKLSRRFTPKLLEKSMRTQRALFAKALSLLKPGGVLVYSTCSVLAEENENVVASGLAGAPRGATFEIEPIELEGIDSDALVPTSLDGALKLCPTELYEGFFVARIRRI